MQLANPDAATYYQWEGKSTSAQYYINPAGAGESEACVWGSPGSDLGNFAPMNLGLGFKGGLTYASIFPNKPTTDATLPFNVKYEGTNTACSWDSSSKTYMSGNSPSESGCTVSIPQGSTAEIIFY